MLAHVLRFRSPLLDDRARFEIAANYSRALREQEREQTRERFRVLGEQVADDLARETSERSIQDIARSRGIPAHGSEHISYRSPRGRGFDDDDGGAAA